MLSPLTANAGSLFQTDTSTYLTRRVADRLFEDMRKQTDAKAESYDARIDPLTTRMLDLSGRIVKYERVGEAVTNAEKQMDEIKAELRELWHVVNDARNASSYSEYSAKSFNAKLQDINDIADRYAARTNLVGRPDPETLLPEPLTARLSEYVDESEFQGPYVGSSFRIELTGDNAGTAFQNSPTANVMKQVDDEDGETVGPTIVHDPGRLSGMTIGDDGSISFSVDGEAYAGTLTKGGLGIMPSWAYEDLSTPEGIQAAFDAIEAAEDHLESARVELLGIKVASERDLATLERQVGTLRQEISDLQDDKILDIYEIETKARQEFKAVEASIQAGASQAGNYARIMGASANGLFTSFLT